MSSTAASPRSRSTVCWVGAAEPIALRALFGALLTEAVDVLLLGGQNIMSVNPDPAEVAARLGIAEGSDVVVRRLTFWLEDMPVALHDGYFPADLVAGTAIEQPRRIRGGADAVIEDPEGSIRRHIARSVDEISGRMPTPGEAQELGLSQGVPVFRILRTVYDTEGRPLEMQDSVAAADRHNFRYEVEMR